MSISKRLAEKRQRNQYITVDEYAALEFMKTLVDNSEYFFKNTNKIGYSPKVI